MNENKPESKPSGARLPIAIIALVFFGPLIAATWMYFSGALTPSGRSNYGVLLEPVVNIRDIMPETSLLSLADGQWMLLYANEAECGEPCREGLYRHRQVRLMLGRERQRVVRVFLHGDSPPDTVFLQGEHPGLKTTSDNDLARLLERKRPQDALPGGIYLVDPLFNLVMYFPPDLDPRELVDDVEHLLELSRIG